MKLVGVGQGGMKIRHARYVNGVVLDHLVDDMCCL